MAHFLLMSLLIGNVVLRVFTNAFTLLPKAFNLIDLPIAWALFLLSRVAPAPNALPTWAARIPARLAWFTVVVVAGSFLNSAYFDLTPAASQYIMLVTPVVAFLAILRLRFEVRHAEAYLRAIRWLIVLEIGIGVLQLPGRIATGNSELVYGTFPGNAEQYATFLMIASFYFMARSVLNPASRRKYIFLIVVLQVLNISIDNKASWSGAVASLGLLHWRLGRVRVQWRSIVALAALLVLLGGAVAYVASKVSTTMYRFDELAKIITDGEITKLGKVKAFVDIIRSHTSNPHMMVVGSGLATFYSRASRQFYLSSTARERLYSNPMALGPQEKSDADSISGSDSAGGVITMRLSEPYFHQFYGGSDLIRAVGSHQVDKPYGPYAGLLGETGLLGCWLYLGVYVAALRNLYRGIPNHMGDATALPLLAVAFGMMVYLAVNSIYGPLLETTRLTTILWSAVALAHVAMSGNRINHPIAAEGANGVDAGTLRDGVEYAAPGR